METKWYLGKLKNENERVYLYDFTWDCDWYWGGGYIGNDGLHGHFKNAFLDTPDIRGHLLGNFITPWTVLPEGIDETNYIVIPDGSSIWEPIETFLDDVPDHISNNWWRIKDLFVQFYAIQKAAEVFRHGGNCTSTNRNPHEINLEFNTQLNNHLEQVIISEIRKVFNKAGINE